ncbi:hypothetical protein [Celeribacter litoreus]|uniref:hypothetical protein n=1 Tax=Celeribacter litoreus TaxID=2876714 RepID=UPI001CCE8E9E|nr:hypothetical protein [Celeribacter litoreus]MCA0044151.1 hypothetical protein [Celeribacter litoreus]
MGKASFARVTPYQLKPGMRDVATKKINGMKGQIMALHGMQRFLNVVNSDNSGYIVAVLDSEEASNRNMAKVREIWGSMADCLQEMPTPMGYDVVLEWEN